MDERMPEEWEATLPPGDPFRTQSIWNLRFTQKPRVLVPDLLVRGSVGLLVSEPHVGKTMLMIDLGLALMTQQPFLGKTPVEPARMTGFFLDGHGWSTRYQVDALALGRHAAVTEDSTFFYKVKNRGFRLDLAQAGDIDNLVECLHFNKVDVCVLDCFSIVNGADENDRMQMQAVLDNCYYVVQETGATIILTDHSPVMARPGASAYPARGSSVKEAAVDFVWHLRDLGSGSKEMRVLKARGMRSAAGDVYEYAIVCEGEAARIELREVAKTTSHRPGHMRRERLEVFLIGLLAEPRLVEVLVRAVVEAKLAPAEVAESAVRNALSRLRKQERVERVCKNTWKRVEA